MLSERRRLSDVATCCNASGDVMHCAGTAGHSTHERALDTVRHATGDPVSAMVNASISQVVLLYSVQLLSFSKTASGTAGARMERRHGQRLRNVGMSAAARAPYAARTSLAHAAAQSRLAHCPAASTAASTVATKATHKRPSFRIFHQRRKRNRIGRCSHKKQGKSYSVRRASIARPSVSSSAYSRSPPTGRPLARRLTSMPRGLMVRAK